MVTIDQVMVQDTLLRLLGTPSFSGEEYDAMQLVEQRLRQAGLQPEYDDAQEQVGGTVGNLIVRVPGTVDAPTLFFNAHIDTVGRTQGLEPQLEDGLIRTQGFSVLGGDDKAGVTAIVEGVLAVLAAGAAHPPLEVVITVQEETGLYGARALDLSKLQAKQGFVFDGGTPLGRLTMSAPSQESQHITFTGRAAHAGVEPEKGVNAIACASTAIARMTQGRLDAETTANVGTISGGQATNIVSEQCKLEAEVRSHSPEKLRRQVAHMREVCEQTAAEFGATVDFQSEVVFESFRIDPNEPVAQLAATALRALGHEVSYAEGGGGSDANIFNAGGLRCTLMNCGQQQVHTPAEILRVADVVDAARVVAQIIQLGAEQG